MKYSRVERYKELREEISKMDSYSFDTPEKEETPKEEISSYEETKLDGEMAESLESLIKAKENYQQKRKRNEMKKKYKAEKKARKKKEDAGSKLTTALIIGLVVIVALIIILVVWMLI